MNPLLRVSVLFAAACYISVVFSCSREEEKETLRKDPLEVCTTFYPTLYFAQSIGGGLIRASCPIPAGEDPIFFEPPPETVLEYQKADLIILNGAGYAKWVSRAMLPEEKIVDAGASFEDDLIVIEEAVLHSHGQKGEHSHTGIDPHTWMDPVLAMEQCRAIAAALEVRDPEHEAAYDEGLKKILAGLADLDRRFKDLQKRRQTAPILASHPAYNYICRRYGWESESFDFDPESPPDAESLKRLKSYLKKESGIQWMVWEEMPSTETAALFRDRFGLEPLVFAPAETPPGGGLDYLGLMRRNIDNMSVLFSKE